MKRLLTTLALLSLIVVLFAACGSGSPTGNDSGDTHSMTLHMDNTNFVQTSITLPKGSSLTLVNDSSVIHIIQNGLWDKSGNPKPGREAGAPTVQVQFNGHDSQAIGPFNTSGTYHLFCTVHQNMTLTLILQ